MGETYPAGERDKGYQRLPFSRTCQAARAKYRGREEPGPGRGLPAQPATQPPLLSRHKPDDTFHHLLSEKRSSQAKWFLPGNLDCVATETTTSRGGGGSIWQRASGTGSTAWPGWVVTKCPVQDGTSEVRWEERGRKGGQEEAGLEQLPSPFPLPLSPEVGCPTLPKVLCCNSWRE